MSRAFVVPADRIARYATIAQGVDVDRVPALVVIRPKRLDHGRRDRLGPATDSRARRASCRRSSTPDTRAARSTTTPDHGQPRGLPNPPAGRCRTGAAPRRAQVLAPEPAGTPGLTPRSRGAARAVSSPTSWSSSATSPEDRARQAIEEARSAAAPRPRRCCSQQGAITAEQLSRAIAERYGLDHVDLSDLPRRHGRGEPDLRQHGASLQGAAGRLRRPQTRCWSRWPTRPTSSRSTTSRSRPALDCQRRGRRRRRHRGADRLASTRCRARSARPSSRARPSEDERSPKSATSRSAPRTRRWSSSSTASSARRSGRVPPTSTSSPTRGRCGSASGSTACSARRRTCRSGWSTRSSRGSRS